MDRISFGLIRLGFTLLAATTFLVNCDSDNVQSDGGDAAQECATKYTSDTEGLTYSLRSLVNFFNKPAPTQFCSNGITLQHDIILKEPIVLSGVASPDGFVLEGQSHTLNARNLSPDVCVITIAADRVTLRDLSITDVPGSGVCVLATAEEFSATNVVAKDTRGNDVPIVAPATD